MRSAQSVAQPGALRAVLRSWSLCVGVRVPRRLGARKERGHASALDERWDVLI